MNLDLDGNAALVTASSSGLGLASATTLASEGAHVTICGRDPDRLAAARDDLADAGSGEVLALECDLTDPNEISRLVSRTVDEFGGLDHLVTSAGGPPSTTFLETDEQDWYQAYDLLVMSVVWIVEEVHAHLLESDVGSITCITSTTVQEVTDGLVLSNSVRRAVVGLVKTISREFAPEIRANAVMPGTIETPRIEELVEAGVERGTYADYDAGITELAAEIPLERLGEPAEFGDVVAFLASSRASFVNGASVPIDGGLLRS
ncbi:putative oxidoreductase (short-chain dehydrogenase family) [Natrialba magadii ATCC 43099]|uniref:Oxidoreductase (Short-chain dehydrogenase family) n=1 Tax=Natrialba magadii (strain ATCC 43099 / DSM 3394 / CCM 3739 / CIP 104546 / IAM 13178 / JCM 8861 / NBRC 102185 / NCIMB 2190 / MS3) TaxID=547559 RepID=D3ST25_NATMM|nr:SDR family oxidoreductase [Natrialba magadii]ADD04971.1 putative oxidoreductase (short-chain dehydrogenase family) [Natrialba magadii ATCC 43099]ELY24019.1 short-chain dehydrogenase/reductase SDR [Natrialba magadii ATCC 43099]